MLPAVSLNHAPTRQFSNPWGIPLLVLSIVGAILLMAWLQQLNAERQRLNTDMQRIQQPASAPALTGKENQAKQQEIAAVKDAMNELALPWQKLFTALENIQGTNIRLTAIEPNARLRKLRITANTDDVMHMFGYVRSLAAQPIFNDVLLMSHEYHNDQPMPVHFIVEAVWIQQ